MPENRLARRDFLKLVGAGIATLAASPSLHVLAIEQTPWKLLRHRDRIFLVTQPHAIASGLFVEVREDGAVHVAQGGSSDLVGVLGVSTGVPTLVQVYGSASVRVQGAGTWPVYVSGLA